MYGLILVDEFDTAYVTALTITDQALWDWLNEPVDFQGASSKTVPLPAGYATEEGLTEVPVTIGSCQNDKAQHLSSVAENHAGSIDELAYETNASDEDAPGDGNDVHVADVKAAFAALGITEVYEGLWY